ncbi:MAG: plasmid maintenance system antidote protein [Ignavibacteria bacterium]|nr:MAG: plasmid maintenance system antidote protein [Ignavibacteria bacterium]KAF0155202.1 MAG: plasmid maintenance system antidote protein [Ignavibacteria bacterium]
MSSKTKIEPIHPGEILAEEFLKPMNISQLSLSQELKISLQTINQIILGKRAITAGTSLLLGKYFGLSESYWLNLQIRYDIEMAKDTYKERLKAIKGNVVIKSRMKKSAFSPN